MAKSKKQSSSDNTKQAIGVLLIGIAILLSLSIISFDVNDPVELTSTGSREPSNWLGPLGANISYYMMQLTLGYPVVVFPLILLLLGLFTIQHKSYADLVKPIGILLLWSILISIYLALPEAFATMGNIIEYYPSGILGGWFASLFVIYLGKFGTLFSLILVTIVLLIISLKIELTTLIDMFKAGMQSIKDDVAGTSSERINRFRILRKEKRRARQQERARAKELKQKNREAKIAQREQKNTPQISIDDHSESLVKVQPEKKPQPEEKKTSGQMTLDEIMAKLEPDKNQNEDKLTPAEKTDIETESVETAAGVDFEVKEEVHDQELDYDQLVKQSLARYKFPATDLLHDSAGSDTSITREELKSNADLLEAKLKDFGVVAKVIRVTAGPVITLYELQPAPGVKVSSITNLANDLALALEARGIRIIAPIPGKAAVGIEIPNRNPQIVYLKSLIRSEKFSKADFQLPLAIGKTINGESYITDLTKMPHILVAGATGSGKSVGINTIICSLLYSIDPGSVKFMMIDPKKLELSLYRDLREHYLVWRPDLDEEIITKPNNAISMLNSIVLEMEKRYDLLAEVGARNIVEYNKRVEDGSIRIEKEKHQKLPYIIVVVDELADLMMVAAKEVEAPIARLAQMARAVGIHLILATQRPSVDVITGMIKANFPARIAYQVATKVDSRTILDMNGAEQLLGNGDMLFLPPGMPKPVRLQNPFISTEEVESIIQHIKRQPKMPYFSLPQPSSTGAEGLSFAGDSDRDPLYKDARAIVVQHQQGSISFLQRRLKVGYARAARLMDELEADGIVGEADGSKPRDVLISLQELDQMD
jgi:S-DNA-T family DNA segregation ATPase FtsK/SpoIIIE